MWSYFFNSSSEPLQTRQELYANLKKLVLCEVCQREIDPVAIVCRIGHAVCLDCGNVEICPVCTNPNLTRRFTVFNRILEAMNDQDNFLETIVELLECPVCYEDVSPEWRNCTQGHVVCRRCRQNTTCCPMCRSRYSCFQSAFVLKIIKELQKKIKCTYHYNGCKEALFKGTELFDHVKTCEYKDAVCMAKECSWTGARKKLGQHFQEEHPRLVIEDKLELVHGTDGVYMIKAGNTASYYFLSYIYNNEGIRLKYHNWEGKRDNFVGSLRILNGAEETIHKHQKRAPTDGFKDRKFFIPMSTIENHGQSGQVPCTFKMEYQKDGVSYLEIMHYAIGGALLLSGCYSLIKSHL